MATQPIDLTYSPSFSITPQRTHVKLAVIAGDAVRAVNDAVGTLPVSDRGLTLDQLAVRGKADALIEASKQLLSPVMYEAFLNWCEKASHFSTRYETDDEGNALCEAHSDAVAAVGAIVPGNQHDQAVQMILFAIEALDCSSFGPLAYDPAKKHGWLSDPLSVSLVDNVSRASPVVHFLNDLSGTAWSLSAEGGRTVAIANAIGSVITARFTAAIAEHQRSKHADRALLDAFAKCRDRLIELRDTDDAASFDEEALWAAEKVIWQSRPSTIEGVIAKLRFGVYVGLEDAFGDYAMIDPSHPDFIEGMKGADGREKLAWGAAEDLARIFGISMTAEVIA